MPIANFSLMLFKIIFLKSGIIMFSASAAGVNDLALKDLTIIKEPHSIVE